MLHIYFFMLHIMLHIFWMIHICRADVTHLLAPWRKRTQLLAARRLTRRLTRRFNRRLMRGLTKWLTRRLTRRLPALPRFHVDTESRGRAVAGAFAYPEMCAYQGAWGSGNGASVLRSTWTPSSRSTLRGRNRLCARSLRRKLPFMRSARTSWWPAPTTRRFF